jgi:hypothetical protein
MKSPHPPKEVRIASFSTPSKDFVIQLFLSEYYLFEMGMDLYN